MPIRYVMLEGNLLESSQIMDYTSRKTAMILGKRTGLSTS